VVNERRVVKNVVLAIHGLEQTVLPVKLSKAGASPTAGLGGPLRIELSPTNIKLSITAGLLGLNVVPFVALRSDPPSVMVVPAIWSVPLPSENTFDPVVTVLPDS